MPLHCTVNGISECPLTAVSPRCTIPSEHCSLVPLSLYGVSLSSSVPSLWCLLTVPSSVPASAGPRLPHLFLGDAGVRAAQEEEPG